MWRWRSKLVESAQDRWRAINAPRLVALVRAGARFENGEPVEGPPKKERRPATRGTRRSTGLDYSSVAAALGLRITVEPMSTAERQQITEPLLEGHTPLLEGHTADPQGLAGHLEAVRTRKTKVPASPAGA